MVLDKSRRHIRRYREIAGVLAKHGWGWLVQRIGLAERLGRRVRVTGLTQAPTHLREMLEELGPTFVKLGQLLSTRPDILPHSYIAELEKLQDTAPTLPIEKINAVIESELGAPVNEVFGEFDETPMAAASLAQVHRARLKDGTPVIVKIQRPGIEEHIETDIEIIYKRARFVESHWERARTYGLLDLVDEFATILREELDYTREARNTERLRDVLARDKHIRVPGVHWQFTTKRVLTLDQLRGVKITDVPRYPQIKVEPKELAKRLALSFVEQVFVDGFFHADPHPGNVLVDTDGSIGLVDCGQVGRLDPESRAGTVRMLMAFEQQDARALADEILFLGIAQDEVDPRRLTIDLARVLRFYHGLPARAVNMGRLLTQALSTSAKHRVRLPASFAVLGKVFANIDGICRQLDPDFNLTEIARSCLGKAVRKELASEGTVTELYRAVSATRSLIVNLPEQLARLIRKAVDGNLRLEFKHHGLDEVTSSLRASSNRIAIALIVAAIIVGSSLIVATAKGTGRLFGLPTLGVIGYVMASVFGVWLIASIIRSPRHK
ncbi:MAG: AarF/ABC1/UbiB kinase family protein [Armatimonadetes bacterium]|nr:AarF/ABC1/UbiB kinase family protein [Armatimonadota bacterium]